jgi:PIN domain nuclease of toxin-antitoxin system
MVISYDHNVKAAAAGRKQRGDDRSEDPGLLADRHRGAVYSVFVSAASASEITTKHRLGMLLGVGDLPTAIADRSAIDLRPPRAMRPHHWQAAIAGRRPVRDPFDRLMIARRCSQNLVLVSNEERSDACSVDRLW